MRRLSPPVPAGGTAPRQSEVRVAAAAGDCGRGLGEGPRRDLTYGRGPASAGRGPALQLVGRSYEEDSPADGSWRAELACCEYIDKQENVLLIGNPGMGKSHLATALAAQAFAKGYRIRFFRTTELVTTLTEARDERSFLRLKAQLAKLDLLVLDELDDVPVSKVGS